MDESTTTTAAAQSTLPLLAQSLQDLAQHLIMTTTTTTANSNNNLYQQQQQQQTNSAYKLVIAVAGGGGHAISTLAATPGASAVLYEGTVAYDRNSFRNYVSASTPSSTATTSACTSSSTTMERKIFSPNFKFASMEAAQWLSEVSLQRGLTYAAVQDTNILTYTSNDHIGIGCASALVSTKHTMMMTNNNNQVLLGSSNENNNNIIKNNIHSHDHIGSLDNSSHHHSRSSSSSSTNSNNNDNNTANNNNHTGYYYARRRSGQSRAFVVATRADGRQWCGNLTLAEGRSRTEEDFMVSHFLLQAAIQVNQESSIDTNDDDDDDDDESRVNIIHPNEPRYHRSGSIRIPNMIPGDEINSWYNNDWSPIRSESSSTVDESNTRTPQQQQQQDDDVVIEAAQRIVQGQAQVILLVPTAKTTLPAATTSSGTVSSTSTTLPSPTASTQYTYRAVQYPVLPHGSLIFPGSYNPPHVGHAELAKAAFQQALCGHDDSNDPSCPTLRPPPAVFMEMSLTNPDKPSMDPHVVSQRAHQFFQLMEHMPQNWGLLLTRAPLFAQKVELLQSLIAPQPAPPSEQPHQQQQHFVGKEATINNNTSNDVSPNGSKVDHHKLVFVLGTDTMIRILNPKYYGNSFEAMVRAVRGMQRHQVHFIAGGRLDQTNQNTNTTPSPIAARFVTGEAELEGLPPDIQDMFTLLTNFRIDISSSAIRRQQLQL